MRQTYLEPVSKRCAPSPWSVPFVRSFWAAYPRSVAQVIVKAILMGRRNFSYPTEIASAEAALKEFSKWLPKVRNKIATGCGMSAVGTSYEGDVYQAVLEMLHLDRNVFSPEFYGELRIHN